MFDKCVHIQVQIIIYIRCKSKPAILNRVSFLKNRVIPWKHLDKELRFKNSNASSVIDLLCELSQITHSVYFCHKIEVATSTQVLICERE